MRIRIDFAAGEEASWHDYRVKRIRDRLSEDLRYDDVQLSYSRLVEIARNIERVL